MTRPAAPVATVRIDSRGDSFDDKFQARGRLALSCALLPAGEGADDWQPFKSASLSRPRCQVAAWARMHSGSARSPAAGCPSRTAIRRPSPRCGARSSAAAFNPAVALILAGNYADISEDPASWQISGFMPSGGEVGPGERSFNLGESELTLNANVDPYFSANFTAAIADENEIGVEEAYFRALALPAGFTAKGGRFFSGLGYLNEIHAHAWDFVDQPLVLSGVF
jgi:hypothetical protein